MAQREDDAADGDHCTLYDEDSSFGATAREVIARRKALPDALDE